MASRSWHEMSRYVSFPFIFHCFTSSFLGIPNTAHFANVTEIEDALALWAKLKEQKAHERQSCKMNLRFYEIKAVVDFRSFWLVRSSTY